MPLLHTSLTPLCPALHGLECRPLLSIDRAALLGVRPPGRKHPLPWVAHLVAVQAERANHQPSDSASPIAVSRMRWGRLSSPSSSKNREQLLFGSSPFAQAAALRRAGLARSRPALHSPRPFSVRTLHNLRVALCLSFFTPDGSTVFH